MNKKMFFAFSFLSCMAVQAADSVIMTVNGKAVTKAEFEYSFNKNNGAEAIDKRSLDEYIVLFQNLKLKVAEAEAQGLDTTAMFRNEWQEYRSQLLDNAQASDSVAIANLLQEFYDGSLSFEITHREVWEKAAKDTGGLTQFFNKNRSKYTVNGKKPKSYTEVRGQVITDYQDFLEKEWLAQLRKKYVIVEY
ncbi:hypothetical protein AGMMS49982_14530 [Bacteroidia bacterium]|nr:hypothetical protein AGMMS49982_14530 [Bacteroidia bacterium]